MIARAAFVGQLAALGVICATVMAILSALTWRHGQLIYRERRGPEMSSHLQATAFLLLTAATVLVAAVAVLVTITV